ncbi:hypothetical protein N9226_01350 [bacterium]|nr:hypothetical protein [bacterium]
MLVTSTALLLALVPGPVPVQIPGATVPPQITRATVPPAPDSLLPLVESVPEGGAPTWPATVAESSGYTRSSSTAQVVGFLESLDPLPRGDWLQRRVIGRTSEGQDLVAG